MKTDIQIAQEAKMSHIREVAQTLGIQEDELELYGKYKAKLSDEAWNNVKDRQKGWQADPCNGDQSDTGRRRKDNNYRRTWTGYGKIK